MSDEIETLDDTGAEAAFAKMLGVPDDAVGAGASQEAAEATVESTEGTNTGEVTEGSQEAPKDSTGAPAPTLASDDALVEIGEGEGKRQVPVKDLKALMAREAEIAARDTTTSQALQRANEEGEKAVTILSTLIGDAEKNWSRYAQVDFILAAQQMPPEAYKQLRADAQEAWQRVSFLKQEAQGFVAKAQANRATAFQAALKECDDALAKDTDPIVKGWDATARKELVEYAVSQGVSKENAAAIIQPAVVKLLRKAALYDKGQAAVAATVKPVATSAPKGVLKPGASDGKATTPAEAKVAAAKSRLSKTGSVEDAEAAFLARLG